MFTRCGILALVPVLSLSLGLSACAPASSADPQRKPAVDELGACDYQFENSKTCLDLIWERKPTESDFGSFVLEFYKPEDRSQFLNPPGTPSVTLWMPSTGQGSSSVTIEKLATGQYRVSKVFFTAHGDWEIQLKLLNASNIVDQVVYPIRF